MTEDESLARGVKENARTSSGIIVDDDKEEVKSNEDRNKKKEICVAFSEITEDAVSQELPIRTAPTVSRRV
jgi:hypothetical protein